MEKIPIIKKVYVKDIYTGVIDTTFNQLISPQKQSNQEKKPNVNDFFQLYNDLFFEIPKNDQNNSHQYLIEKSIEYLGDGYTNPIIQELQEEITSLKKQLLSTSTTIGDLTNQLSSLGDQFKSINK